MWREGQHNQILDADVLPAAQKVRRAFAAIVLILLGQQTRALPDMQHEGRAGFSEERPEGIKIRMPGGHVARRGRWYPKRLAAKFDRLCCLFHRTLGISQRDGPNAQQARIICAESGHGAIMGTHTAIHQARVLLAHILRGGES